MAISAEQLNVILSARDREFTRAMERAQRRVERFSRESNQSLGKTSQAWGALAMQAKAFIPALSAGVLIAQTRRVVSELDQLGKTADKLGLTTDALQELRVAAESAGVSSDTLDMAMQRFGRRLAEARQGAGEAKGALEEMGIELFGAGGRARSTEEVLNDVADAMQGMSVQTDRNRIAMRLFDSEGVALVNMLRDGSDGLDSMRQQARDLGIVIDEDLIRGAEDAENQLGLMSRVIDANLTQALINLAPLLVAAAEGIAGISRAINGIFDAFSGEQDVGSQIADLIAQQADLRVQMERAALAPGDPSANPAIQNYQQQLQAVNAELNKLIAAQNDAESGGGLMPLEEIVIDSSDDVVEEVERVAGATRSVADAAEDATDNIEDMLTRIIEASPALQQLGFDAEGLRSVMGTVQSSMENAFMGMLDGTATAGDAFRAMAADIIRELYRVLVVQRLVGSFSAGGGGIMGSLFGALGGRASGGPVQAGQPYTVGEHGRELFVPSTSGRVLSAAQTQNAMRGDGGVTIHQTFQFSANGDDSVKRIIAQEAPKIAALTQKQIVDQRRRGGAMKGAFG